MCLISSASIVLRVLSPHGHECEYVIVPGCDVM